MTSAAPDAPPRRRPPFTAFLELLALTGFAFAQPLLDVFGRSPEQFAFRDASRAHVVAFGLIVAVVPAIGLFLVELVVGLVAGARVRNLVHLVVLGGLGVLAVLQVAKHAVSLRGPGLVALALGVAAGFLVLFVRAALVRSWVRVASVAPALFLALFLVSSPVGETLWDSEPEATAAVEVDRPAPVVMLLLDELPLTSLIGPDGRIDSDRYPGFSELAEQSTWYRNSTAVTSATWHAVPAILTGRYPHAAAPVAAHHPDNLFTLLGGRYDLDVDESITRLCPSSVCEDDDRPASKVLKDLGADARDVWGQQVSPHESEEDPVAGLVEQPAAEEDEDGFQDFGLHQPARYEDFLADLEPSESPTLHYLHVLLPHVPWRYLPSGRQYPHPETDPGKLPEEDAWVDDPWPPELGRERHLLQAQYVDRLVRALLDRLHQTGLFDDALVIVTADHGVAFQAGQPVRGLSEEHFAPQVAPELMWVPLFVKAPDQTAGGITDAGVETVDILPTIADTLGIDLPWDVDGVSALGGGREQDDPKHFFQSQVVPFGVTPGEEGEVDPTEGWAAVLQRSIPEELQGGGPLDGYRVGPRPELVGRDVDDFAVGSTTDVRAVVDDADRYTDVDPRSSSIPSLVRGHLEGAPDGSLVVLSVGGRVAAVVPTWQDGDRRQAFDALLPESLLPAGDADLQVTLLGPGDSLRPTVRD